MTPSNLQSARELAQRLDTRPLDYAWPELFKLKDLKETIATIARLADEVERLERDAWIGDAAIGKVVWRFIDRMTDLSPETGDSAEVVLAAFVKAVEPVMEAKLKITQPHLYAAIKEVSNG